MARTGYNTKPYEKHMEVFQNFTGGLNTVSAPDTMLDNELTSMLNEDIGERGTLKRRHGFKKVPSMFRTTQWSDIGAKKWSDFLPVKEDDGTPVVPPEIKKILPYGDSKTYGAGDDGTGERGYPQMLQGLLPNDNILTRVARPGYTVAQMKALIDEDVKNYTTVTDVLFNLGTNDVNQVNGTINKTTWVNNVLYIIDALQSKFSCRVYLARFWRETHNGQLTTINDVWIPEIVASRQNVFLGMDERTFLPTKSADGIHPTHDGYVIMSEEWKEVL